MKICKMLICLLLCAALLCLPVQAEADQSIRIENGNAVQQYRTEDGSLHTVYWAKGVQPPKMTSDPDKLGTEGYFEMDKTVTEKITNITYQYPLETGHGYYDMNKSLSKEAHMCYLAASGNLLYWWMEQNRPYIDRYRAGLADGTYVQQPGLVDPAQIQWDRTVTGPGIVEANGLKQMLLRSSYLMTTAFRNNYYKRYDDGYWMDLVLDFFLNGYRPIRPIIGGQRVPVNTPNSFEANPDGGYFFPIFGKNVLTSRYTTANYDFYSRNMRPWLLDGYGITIGYLVNSKVAHALTVWGAEYDGQDRLCRIFVTDSDDPYNTSLTRYDTVRGLHGMDIRQIGGLLYLGNNRGPAAGNGNMIDNLVTLSLGQDTWEAVMNDPDPLPGAPEVELPEQDRIYALGAQPDPIRVHAAVPEKDVSRNGYLTFQWYESRDPETAGTEIPGAVESTLTPEPAQEIGVRYYTCVITNHKYGKEASVTAPAVRIETADLPEVSAARPSVDFTGDMVTFPQHSRAVLSAQVRNPEAMGTVSYQWYQADNNTDGGYRRPLPGENGPTLTVPTGEAGARSYYYCVVENYDDSPEITGSRYGRTVTPIKRVNITENPQQPGVHVYGTNMTLGNELVMRFFVRKADITHGSGLRMQITKTYADGREPVVQEVPFDRWESYNDSYTVTFGDISAKEMTDSITAQVLYGDGSPAGELRTDSVAEYALRILRRTDTGLPLKRLIVDMLHYGAAAQKTFSYGLETMADRDLTESERALASDPVVPEDVRVKGPGYFGANLNLGSSMALTVYFREITPDMHAVISYQKHNKTPVEVTVDGSDFIRYNSNVYGVRAETLVVADAQQPVSVTVYDAQGRATASGVDSIASYVSRSRLGELGQAILKFAASAEIYFAER